MTLAEVVHQQINEILEKEYPRACPSCEPINPAEMRGRGLGEGAVVECMLCGRKGQIVKLAHPFGDRWVIQPQ
jgi:hypothetical protein